MDSPAPQYEDMEAIRSSYFKKNEFELSENSAYASSPPPEPVKNLAYDNAPPLPDHDHELTNNLAYDKPILPVDDTYYN